MHRRPTAVRLAVVFALVLPAVAVAGPSLVGHAQDQDDWRTTCTEIEPGLGVLGDIIGCLDAVINQIGSVGPNALASIVAMFSSVIMDIAKDIQSFGESVHIKQLVQAGEIIERFAKLTSGLAEAFNEVLQIPGQIVQGINEAINSITESIRSDFDRFTDIFRNLGERLAGLFVDPIANWLQNAQNVIQEAFGI